MARQPACPGRFPSPEDMCMSCALQGSAPDDHTCVLLHGMPSSLAIRVVGQQAGLTAWLHALYCAGGAVQAEAEGYRGSTGRGLL